MKELNIPAKLEALDQVIQFAEKELELMDCPMKEQVQIDIALEEMYVNVAHYAYPNENASGEGLVCVQLERLSNGVLIRLIDQGIEFDPLKKPDPDTTLPAGERSIGGLGIFMVKKSMDRVMYKRECGSNIFEMEKHW